MDTTDKRLYLILAILGILLLLAPKAITWFEFGDGMPYHLALGAQTAQDPVFGLTQPQPFLYYFLLAGLYAVSLSIVVTGMLSPIFSILAVLIAYWFFRKHFNKSTSFLASLFFLLTPDFVSIGTSTHIEPLLTILILVSFQFMLQSRNKLSGIAFGIAQLTKYSSLAFFPVVVFHDLIDRRKLDKKFLKKILVIIIISLIVAGGFYLKNAALYGSAIYPRNEFGNTFNPGYVLEKYSGPTRYLAMTFNSYYFSNTNVGDFFPEEGRFATGSMLFPWGNVLSITTPGGREVGIHVFDILSSGLLFLLMLIGGYTLYKKDRKLFFLFANFVFWFALLYFYYSLTPNSAPSTRFSMPIYPFLSLLTSLGVLRFSKKKWFLPLVAISLIAALYLYTLQIDRMLIFSQHYQEVLNHPYIQETLMVHI